MANMELLRILAMLMVVMLHYLSKGKVLPQIEGQLTVNGWAAWILETLSIAAVDVYVLISGFFLVEAGFKCRRLLQLLCQVLFYSILVPAVLMGAGILSVSDISVYTLLQYILPAEMEHYWFVTAYVLMYLFSPVLNTAVKSMKKNQLKLTIILLLLFLSVNKSILPVHLEMDKLGYDGVWFICVYLVAAYMRLYGISFLNRAGKGVLCYFASCGLILGIALLVRLVYRSTGILENFLIATYHYNHILNLAAAVSLFYVFYHWRLPEGRLSNLIVKVASCTFGVYLLHEQLDMRYLWPQWLGADASGNVFVFVFRAIFSVLAVLLVGVIVDSLRGWLFALAGRLFKGGRIDRLLSRADDVLAGKAG